MKISQFLWPTLKVTAKFNYTLDFKNVCAKEPNLNWSLDRNNPATLKATLSRNTCGLESDQSTMQ